MQKQVINSIKNAKKNHFLLLKNFKNTGSAFQAMPVFFFKTKITACNIGCLQGAALVSGGLHGSSRLAEVEVWTEDGQSKRLSDLPDSIQRHSMDYVYGELFVCGGKDGDGSSDKCLKGEYQPSTKGRLVHCHSACSI